MGRGRRAVRSAPPPLLIPMRRLPPEWRDLAPIMLTATLVGMTFSLAIPLLSLVLERAGVDTFGDRAQHGGRAGSASSSWHRSSAGLVARPRRGRLLSRWRSLVTAACMLIFPLWVDPMVLVLRCGWCSACAGSP